MARQGVTLMCYWNGRVTSGAHGISYEGATPKPIRVSYGITYNELLDKIYGVTGFDKHQFKLKITCRYPACREYIPVPIDDDESIDIMFDVARQPGTNCMELYLERVSKPIGNQVNVTVPAERVSVPIENHVNVTVPAHTNKQVSFRNFICFLNSFTTLVFFSLSLSLGGLLSCLSSEFVYRVYIFCYVDTSRKRSHS
jgi:hypothetical protein